ncbi:MAG: hypothetical protein IKC40_06380 [Oscillospiraceae bacterium]|nr:hypothetical protein [Oscillospiraceae bacterium]MBR6618462.1 hypothetical protein [Oscillospiraceae bacterium]
MKRMYLLPLLLPLLLTGCGTEHISERLYTQTLGLQGRRELTIYAQPFGEDAPFSAEGKTAADALRNGEAAQGSRIFIGHTELLCTDGTRTLEDIRELLSSRGLSPACKLLYTDVDACFQRMDTASLLESLRMAERRGMIAQTDVTTALDEWMGDSETALLPAISDSGLCMVLLHTNGRRTTLSEDAANGMFWLRRNNGKEFILAVETPEGVQDVTILRSSLQKKSAVQDGRSVLLYNVTVYADNCPEALHRPLQEHILRQCRTAIAEMLEADADVVGLHELAAFTQTSNTEQPIVVNVTVR